MYADRRWGSSTWGVSEATSPASAAAERGIDASALGKECRVLSPDPKVAGRISAEITDHVAPEPGIPGPLQLQAQVPRSEKLESLALLAGGVAHDFNNLLTAILGHAELALMQLEPEAPARHQVERIAVGARRAADLASELLTYASRGQRFSQPVELSGLLREVTPLLEGVVGRRDSLRLDLPADAAMVRVDPVQLQRVLVGLVSNAAEALGEEGGTVRLRAGLQQLDAPALEACAFSNAAPGSLAFVEVSDSGRGLDAENHGRIFDPFFSTKGAGRGLGLAAVLGFARNHGGALRVSSIPGRGSSFTLLLPAEGPADSSSLSGSLETSAAPARHVLVVDDEVTVREVIAEILQSAGYRVTCAVDGRQALELYARHGRDFDLVLLDMTMPHLNGVQTLDRLRSSDPLAKVVGMSGFAEHDAVHRFGEAGLLGFLQKPFATRSLVRCVARVLGEATS